MSALAAASNEIWQIVLTRLWKVRHSEAGASTSKRDFFRKTPASNLHEALTALTGCSGQHHQFGAKHLSHNGSLRCAWISLPRLLLGLFYRLHQLAQTSNSCSGSHVRVLRFQHGLLAHELLCPVGAGYWPFTATDDVHHLSTWNPLEMDNGRRWCFDHNDSEPEEQASVCLLFSFCHRYTKFSDKHGKSRGPFAAQSITIYCWLLVITKPIVIDSCLLFCVIIITIIIIIITIIIIIIIIIDDDDNDDDDDDDDFWTSQSKHLLCMKACRENVRYSPCSIFRGCTL